MVEIPDRPLAQQIITECREYGEPENSPTANEGEYGQYEFDVDVTLSDLKPSECDIDVDGETILVHGSVEGTYSVQVSRRTHSHPAEYENRTQRFGVTIEYPLGDGLPRPTYRFEHL